MKSFKVGDRIKVVDTKYLGWIGEGEIIFMADFFPFTVNVRMLTGPSKGFTGGFEPESLRHINNGIDRILDDLE